MEGSIDIDTLELDERQPATFSTSLRPEVIQKVFIDGEWREPVKKNRLPISNPATEETIGDIPAATVEDVDNPVKAARRALRRDDWGSTTGAQRAKYLRAIAAKVQERRPELATLETIDNGKPLNILTGLGHEAGSPLIDRERPGPSWFGNAHHGQGPDSCRDKLGIRARLMVPGLAGVALVAPVINYWWHGFPANLSTKGYNLQFPRDQWALRVAHYAPGLVYWWNTQKWFPYNSVIVEKFNRSPPNMEVASRFAKHASEIQKHNIIGFLSEYVQFTARLMSLDS
ncbi:hypothetical protein T459_20500 [Capsicum annuum]|uniref:Aldehyde dehydrogenase domain-containing protein n=1 Tax=Capsicum annuum TaxID=4072 RepID=A0A2G2Z4N8_CAPAN|nr:hypothetical protein T459_20500 [Capsicum annuum]